MIIDSVWDWLINNIVTMTVFAANLMLHSTVIIALCLFACFMLRKRHAIFHAFLFRACLVTIMLSPLLSIFSEIPGESRFSIQMPSTVTTAKHSVAPRSIPGNTRVTPAPKALSKPTLRDAEKRGAAHHAKRNRRKTLSTNTMRRTESARPETMSPPVRPREDVPEKSWISAKWATIIYAAFIAVWVVLSLILAVKMVLSYLLLVKIRHSSCPADPSYQKICREAERAMGIDEVPVYQSHLVKDVFLGGIRNPAIYLPLNGTEATIASKEVFLHELTHYVRHDNHWNVLCRIGTILLPLQPLMWVLAGKIRIVGDYICDDFVVSHQRDHYTYAVQMYTIARLYRGRIPRVVTGTGIATGKSTLLLRIKRILDTTIPRSFKLHLREILSTVFLYFCALVITGFSGFRTNAFEQLIDNTSRTASDNIKSKPFASDESNNKRLNSEEAPHSMYQAHAEQNRSGSKSDMNSERPELKAGTGMDSTIPVSSVEFNRSPVELNIDPRNGNKMPDNAFFASSIVDKPERSLSGAEHAFTDIHGNETKHEYTYDANMFGDIASQEVAINTAGLYSAMRPVSRYAASAQSSEQVFRALDITIPDEYEYSDMSDSKHERMAEIYRSLRKNKKYPCWSPDGGKIAFNDSDYGVWVVNADGGEPRLVYDNYYRLEYQNYNLHFGELRTLGFSPDGLEIAVKRYDIDLGRGTKVIFDTTGQVSVYVIENPVPVIESINLETGKHHVLAEGAITGCWSRNGRYFAYITEDDSEDESPKRNLWILDRDRDTRREIDCSNPSTVSFAPNDDLIVAEHEPEKTCRITRIPLNGGSAETMFEKNNAMVSDVSPDGEWLLYNDGTVDTRGGVIESLQVLYHIRTGELREILPAGKTAVAWGRFSPDGGSVCLNVKEGRGYWNVYTHDLQLSESVPKDTATDVLDSEPSVFAITGNYPNPFNMSTTIEFTVAENDESLLLIFNSLGQKVRELVSGNTSAGVHRVVWDGCDDSGNTVSAGMYIARLQAGEKTDTLKMTLMK